MIKSKILFNGKTYPVEFFNDDTIETVQQQISRSIDIHPDRLYILVGLELPSQYYKKDPRNWEKLFNRLSLDGLQVLPETFKTYCNDLRIPALDMEYQKMDREQWMLYDKRTSKSDFIEYRILGVESVKSYCLPLDFSSIALKIPTAQYPIPELQKLFLSFYNKLNISNFIVKQIEEVNENESPYFPLFKKTSPLRLSELQITSLQENSKHLKDLLSLKVPTPINTKILKSIWKIDLVDTIFGDAVRTRFEQMFYGLTLSEDSPAITFWTSSNEISRHKFYRKTGEQIPLLDIAVWKRWFTISKPARDKVPILILYKGTNRENFDRITISPYDIIFASYRDSDNTEEIEDLKQNLLEWFSSLDSIISFIKETDYTLCRFDLQEVKLQSFYSNQITKFDISRMNCLTGIFDESKKNKSIFRFLRSDHINDDINSRDLKIINMLKENRLLTPKDIEAELKINLQDAAKLLDMINQKIEEDPELLVREHRKFPKVEVKEKSIVITDISDIDRYISYSNILRFILSNPSSPEVDKICPKKIEVSESTFVVTNTVDIDTSDIFDYLETSPKKEETTIVSKEKEGKASTGYSYFHNRLKQKFNLVEDYPKQCEKPHQPIIFTDEDLAAISGKPYDPRNYPEKKLLPIDDPPGLVLCPDYWCMTDEIPLSESQLEEKNGELTCPVCHGKIRDPKDTKTDIIEFSVLKRKEGFSYPKFKNDEKNIPCCYKTPREIKIQTKQVEDQGKYYIMNETKTDILSFRLAYLSKELLKSLQIKEKYELSKSSNRIQSGMSGYFRVGLQKPSQELPELLQIDKTVLSPRFSISSILRCAFISTWSSLSDKYSKEIEEKLDMKPFSENQLAKKTMAKIISSISEVFEEGKLNQIYELEYSAIVLKIDLFRINILDNTISCSFFTPQTVLGKRGIIILQIGDRIDCLSHVRREVKKMVYKANIFKEPFLETTTTELYDLRMKACDISIPSYNKIVGFIKKNNLGDYKIILDPFGRAQALYSPNNFILPFQSIALPPVTQTFISGYHKVKELPSYTKMIKLLNNVGYGKLENIHDSQGNTVEILTGTGLRIPIIPFKELGQTSEITKTILNIDESDLTFGEPSKEDLQIYKTISYNSEIHEFLIFQLSKDLDNYPALKNALFEKKSKNLEILLENWFEETTIFMKLNKPIEFLSKIRKPCGQLKEDSCKNAHMCAWTENTCKIQIRDEFSKDKVFKKLLNTLMENSKIRALVLDGRVTPFFSTILYLELPNEIIITDREVKQFTQSEP